MTLPLILSALAVGVTAVFVGATYPRYRREMRAAETRVLAGSEIAQTVRGSIEYAVHGEGVPVLLLHGAGGGYDQGLLMGKVALGDGYRMVSVSRYGYLRSPVSDTASIRTQAALYESLLDYLNIPKVIVIGGSAGGPSAMQFANDFPERTSALILISALSEARLPGDKPSLIVGIIHLIQQSDYVYWLIARFLRSAILNLLGIPANVYAKFTPVQKQIAQEMLDTMHPMTRRYAGTIKDGEMIQHQRVPMEKISAPTLILHARDDTLVSYQHAEHAHEAIKASRIISFDTGGHGLLSQADAVRRHVREFLGGL